MKIAPFMRRSSLSLLALLVKFPTPRAYPRDMEPNCAQAVTLASGGGVDIHGVPATPGSALSVSAGGVAMADGEQYSPGTLISVDKNPGNGDDFGVWVSAGTFAGGLCGGQMTDSAATFIAPGGDTLTLVGMRARGVSEITYEVMTLNSDGSSGGGGGGVPPGGGSNLGAAGSSEPLITDAGVGLFATTCAFLGLYVLQRQVRALLKEKQRRELKSLREQGLATQAADVPPPPPAQAGYSPPMEYNYPPQQPMQAQYPMSPPPSPPMPPPPPQRTFSEWVPQVDDGTGRQYFWNKNTGAVQWEPPGLPGPAPAHVVANPTAEQYGLDVVEIEIMPVGNRRKTLSAPKQSMTDRQNKFFRFASRRVRYLDVTVLEAVVFAGYLLLNLLWATVFAAEDWILADSFGYLAAANGLFVVIPASRNSLWAWIFGLPFDKTITIHRWIGRLTVVEATLHLILYLNDWMPVAMMFQYEKYKNGTIAWIALLVVFATSIERLRRRKYYAFYFLHFAFLFFYLFSALHTPKFHFYGYFAMLIYGLDKAQRVLRGVLSTRRVSKVELLTNDIMRVSILKPWWSYPQLGQYVFLNFPAISKFEWHPYTLASSPLEEYFEVDIKKLGDHTKKLLETFRSGEQPLVRIDGPYGRVVINPRRYRSLVFVCGGIGVTPMISMLRWYYLINAPPAVAAKQSIHLAEFIYFLWVVDTRSTYDVFRDTVLRCVKSSAQPGFPTFVPLLHVTRDEARPEAFGLTQQSVFQGRPDMKHVLGSVKQNGINRHAVFCCGPSQLVNSTWEATSALSDEQIQFEFHHETFEF